MVKGKADHESDQAYFKILWCKLVLETGIFKGKEVLILICGDNQLVSCFVIMNADVTGNPKERR